MRTIVCLVIGVAACGDNLKKPKNPDAGPTVDSRIDGPVDGLPDAPADACACATTATGATRGSSIAVTPDDSTVVSVNRDVGTVTVAHVDYADSNPAMTKTVELDVGGASCEPWEVTIDACGKCAYVVTRQAQKVVRIENLETTPTVGASVSVGSEPTSIAITPNNKSLFVANWVDGTLSVIDSQTLVANAPVDLNATLVGLSAFANGTTPRPGLAHPRDLAITNNGDASDDDEHVLVTEFYAQRGAATTANGANADRTHISFVYKVPVAGAAPILPIQLPGPADTGFNDHTGATTGCFANQLSSVTIDGNVAWVTSTCASPKGPLGVFTGGLCTLLTQATDCGIGGTCNNGTLTCNPNPTDVKATTHPAMSAVNLTTNTATTQLMDKLFETAGSTRMPLLPSDIGFKGTFAYVTGAGTDAAFRLTTAAGVVTAVGSTTNKFINLRKPMDGVIRMPSGIAIANGVSFAFVNNEGSRDITALSLNAQAIAGDQTTDFRILQASALPMANSTAEKILKGKRFFTTGLGRWSLGGAGWGSCAACHPDGLSDNVTWYFGRGPRQSTSLDGSFASLDAADQRIFNWTAVFDEVADFESNTRGVSGGVGALVTVNPTPPTSPSNADRINTSDTGTNPQTIAQQGLQGSSDEIADPLSVSSAHTHTVLTDWLDIKAYIQSIRSPRAAKGFAAADIAAGAALYAVGVGNCVGCHSGPKWTISKRFYAPGDIPNAATNDAATTSLSNTTWNVNLNGFPAALMPVDNANLANAFMRFGAPPGAEQLQCALRPVGTFGVSDASTINVQELRQDMTTAGQGNAATGRGFNPPSLLGLQVGAPFFHAGNARTLEELFNVRFAGHHQSAVAQVFAPTAVQVSQLVAFLLSIDESTPPINVPALGNTGGTLCFYP